MPEKSPEELAVEIRELEEAVTALGWARERIAEALDRLASAHSWGTYDTWFGGGLFSSMIKHGRIDDAEAAMRRLDDALATVRKELADVGIGPVGGVGIEPLSRTLDIWFDNIFSDFSAQSRIKDAQRRLGSLVDVLGEVDAELGRRLVAARAQLEA